MTMDWNLIETAPLGEPVLVYDPEGVKPDCEYLGEGWPSSLRLYVVPAIQRRHERSGHVSWWTCISWCDGGVYDDPSHDRLSVEVHPTHWMPPPDPPGGWRPIATVPDGVRVLVKGHDRTKPMRRDTGHGEGFDVMPDEVVIAMRRVYCGQPHWWADGDGRIYEPTHWMPVPGTTPCS